MENYKKKYKKYKKKYNIINEIYDYIIVGGGSSGAVIAARLSEDENKKVLLIEAGPDFKPKRFPKELTDSSIIATDKYDWGYKTLPNKYGVSIDMPRAKCIGGCSSHNATAAIRGTPADFDNWNIKGWSFDDVLPYYKKLENTPFGIDRWHGREGPMPVRHYDVSKLCKKFIETTVNSGFSNIEDFNNGKQNGVGISSRNAIGNIRQNTGMTYLNDKVRERKNLIILDKTLVDKLVFDDSNNNKLHVNGVVLSNGVVLRIKNDGEVILSGGTFGSPAILQRSGIGPKSKLKQIGIKTVIDLPVGEILFDHPLYYDNYHIVDDIKKDDDNSEIGTLLWTKILEEKNHNTLNTQIIAFKNDHKTFTVGIALTQPESIGNFIIKDTNPHSKPLINPNYLYNDIDIDKLTESIKLSRRICEINPIKNFVKLSDPVINLTTFDSFGHPSSTVALGKCIDSECKIYLTDNLRVVDASIFPKPLSAPLNLTCIMAGEKIADIIKNKNK
jgi:choline dehydrogenase